MKHITQQRGTRTIYVPQDANDANANASDDENLFSKSFGERWLEVLFVVFVARFAAGHDACAGVIYTSYKYRIELVGVEAQRLLLLLMGMRLVPRGAAGRGVSGNMWRVKSFLVPTSLAIY